MEIRGLYKSYEEKLESEKLALKQYKKNKQKKKNIKLENALAKSISRVLHLVTDIVAYILASLGLFCLLNPQTKTVTISALKEVYQQILNLF